MKINYKDILNYLFIIGLFFFSFNHVEVMPFMGEYIKESGAIFFFLGFFLLCIEVIKTGKIYLPIHNKLYILLVLFYALCIICTLMNYSSVSENYFKRTSGISRFIRQMISLSIPIFIFIPFFWKILKDLSAEEIFNKIRTILLYTLYFASFYGFFEILYSYFGIYPARYITDFIGEIVPFIKPTYHQGGRISAFAYEPPFFAIFLITISGWMFSYIITGKNLITKLSPTILILILTFFSGSRTGLLVVFFTLILFTLYLYKKNIYRKQLNFLFIGLIITSFSIVTISAEKFKNSIEEKIESLNFTGNLKTSISNKSRFGMQFASIEVFKENPIFGVGYGQQTYQAQYHYPRWATKDNYEFDLFYKNKKELSFPPGYNIYTRILAELGIVGFISWLSILIYSLYLCYKFLYSSDYYIRILTLSITISLIGLYINWLQIDTFRMYGVWINFVILMRLSYLIKSVKNE